MTNFRFSAAANSSSNLNAPDIGATISSIKAGVTQFDDPCVKCKPPTPCLPCDGDEISQSYVVEVGGFSGDAFPAEPGVWSDYLPSCSWSWSAGTTDWNSSAQLASSINGTYTIPVSSHVHLGNDIAWNFTFVPYNLPPSYGAFPPSQAGFGRPAERATSCGGFIGLGHIDSVAPARLREWYWVSTGSEPGDGYLDWRIYNFQIPAKLFLGMALYFGGPYTAVKTKISPGLYGTWTVDTTTIPRGITVLLWGGQYQGAGYKPTTYGPGQVGPSWNDYPTTNACWTDSDPFPEPLWMYTYYERFFQHAGRSFMYAFNLPYSTGMNCDVSNVDVPLLFKSNSDWVGRGSDNSNLGGSWSPLPGNPTVRLSSLSNYQRAMAGRGAAASGANLGGVEIG